MERRSCAFVVRQQNMRYCTLTLEPLEALRKRIYVLNCIKNITYFRYFCPYLKKCVSVQDLYSLPRSEVMLFPLDLTSSALKDDQFSVFTVAFVHLFDLRISKKLKEFTVGYDAGIE